MESLTDDEIIRLWDTIENIEERDKIYPILQARGLFPSKYIGDWEKNTGAYPEQSDPLFLQKLLAKREFAESLQTTWEPDGNPCDSDSVFEVTPVQRFVANLMNPRSPYMSALLYHGVGVGKTCAAVQITEAWLEAFPRQKVFLIAPPTIQQGFYRTIFDILRVKIAPEDTQDPNTQTGCTGDTYLKLTGNLYERDKTKIEKRVLRAINRRYNIFGYLSFANYVRDLFKKIPAGITDENKIQQLQSEILRKEFSGKLLVVDEAHNLRDVSEVDTVTATADNDLLAEEEGGKLLTPFLKKVLQSAESLKLVLLTATPMYNSYREIIFILNLLLMNDKKSLINESDVFNSDGTIKPRGTDILGAIANKYMSFMRGENPKTFPIRLFPMRIPTLGRYPLQNPRGGTVPDDEKEFIRHLPIVPIELTGDALSASLAFMNALPQGSGGLSTIALERIVQAGNFIVPPSEGDRDDIDSYRRRTEVGNLMTIFQRETIGGDIRYRAKKENGARWLDVMALRQFAPKFSFLIQRLSSSDGCAFIYTRFVNGGALPLALALEANGYTAFGRRTGLLANGIQTPGGRQCAVCSKRELEHDIREKEHFIPAYYGLITGDEQLSPYNEATIRAQRDITNKDGYRMKVIIGSQIASEGVDFRFLREIHVLDSWFHLNKTEQVLGRGIRFCSHSALPFEKRNTTVYLYAAVLPEPANRETGDLYSYRVAFRKAIQMGRVSRVLKQYAIDCNLNRNAIVIAGQEPVRQEDSQREIRPAVSINDTPYTAICDWIESCPYKCIPEIPASDMGTDDTSYDEYAARWRLSQLKERIAILFEEQPFIRDEDLLNLFSDVPNMIKVDILTSVINNKSFQIEHNGQMGYIRYCNRYFVFQPNRYSDITIPLAIRSAKLPIKRDTYTPVSIAIEEPTKEENVGHDGTITPVNSSELLQTWRDIINWCTLLSASEDVLHTFELAPPEILKRITEMGRGDRIIQIKYEQIASAINWFIISFHMSRDKSIDACRRILLQFIWDNWFSLEEQKYIAFNGGDELETVIGETTYAFGRISILRFINPMNGRIEFYCNGETPCQKSIIDALARETDDPLRKYVISKTQTGPLYGFIVPKKGSSLVFKTAEPPADSDEKLARGAECGNVSTTGIHIAKLIKLGTYLVKTGKGDFDLRTDVIQGTRKIESSTRICALMEIILRYMDDRRLGNKKWFYRPVPAFYAGHKGTVSVRE